MNPIEVCKTCKNKNFDPQKGIVCGLTSQKPDFTETCPDFQDNYDPEQALKDLSKRDIRPNSQRAQTAKTFILIVFIANCLLFFLTLRDINLINAIESEALTDSLYSQLESHETLSYIGAIMYFIVYLLSGIFFIMWFRRAYFNIGQRTNKNEFSDGWAAGAWFVPIVNLGRPYKIMEEVFDGNRNELEKHDHIFSKGKGIVILWWTLWIAILIFTRVSNSLADSYNMQTLLLSDYVDIFIFFIEILLTFVTFKLIGLVDEMESHLQDIETNQAKTLADNVKMKLNTSYSY